MVCKVCCLLNVEVVLKWLFYINLLDDYEVFDNEEKFKGIDIVYVGYGLVDCLVLYKKGFYVVG